MKINRLLLWLPALFFLCLTANAESVLWYGKPASEWREALPVGNGRIDAMVFGGISEERIQLNEAASGLAIPRIMTGPALSNICQKEGATDNGLLALL
jgi:Glycosyl hydrolase family 65, N-terminal domain